jgi:Uma2 family endonuclease
VQFELGRRLYPLGGKVLVEASVLTSLGLLVADVAWGSPDFVAQHGTETPFSKAPELCVEIASPSNSLRELREKVAAYVEAGAAEAWIGYPQSKRIEFLAATGPREKTSFVVDLEGLFD